MRKAAGCVLLAILCLLGASYLPRILQEAQTDREQQNLISGYIQIRIQQMKKTQNQLQMSRKRKQIRIWKE